MRSVSPLALAVVSSACWSLSSTVPDVTGGLDDETNIPDSGTPDPDAAGTTDATTPESGPGSDGGDAGDAGDAGDGATGPYCATLGAAAFLCDDFSTGTFAPGWSSTAQGTGGSIAFADGTFIARSRQPCVGGYGQLIHTAPKKTAGLRVAFSFRAAALPPNAVNHVTGMQYVTASGYYRVDLATVYDKLELVENVTGVITTHTSGVLSFTSARRIELAVNLVAKNATVKVDGTQVIATNIQAPDQSTDATRLELGVYSSSCPGSVDFVYDDFTYERQDR